MSNIPQLKQERIENAVIKVCDFVDSNMKKTPSWKEYDEEQLWFELVSCILGSRVRHETAIDCTIHLRDTGLLDIPNLLQNPRKIEKEITKELCKPIFVPFSKDRGSKYHYPKSKAKCIVNSGIEIYGKNNETIRTILEKCHDGYNARDTLVKKCTGIGPKQASLFLRNIAYSDDLAILDCHIINYMKMINLDEDSNILNQKKLHSYYKEENKLRMYAISKRRKLATLDVGIWTVMRVIRKGIKI